MYRNRLTTKLCSSVLILKFWKLFNVFQCRKGAVLVVILMYPIAPPQFFHQLKPSLEPIIPVQHCQGTHKSKSKIKFPKGEQMIGFLHWRKQPVLKASFKCKISQGKCRYCERRQTYSPYNFKIT